MENRYWGMLMLVMTGWWLGGCAAAVPVVGDAAGEAVKQSAEVTRWGKVETYQAVGLEEGIAAVRRAAEKLALKSEGEEKHPEQLKLLYRDDRNQEVVVTVVRRTERAVMIRVDVGLFGPEGLGALVLEQVLVDLRKVRKTSGATGENGEFGMQDVNGAGQEGSARRGV